MEKLKQALLRLKEKYWDFKVPEPDDKLFGIFGLKPPPFRRCWETHKPKLKEAVIWLLLLIAGGIITKLLGLA